MASHEIKPASDQTSNDIWEIMTYLKKIIMKISIPLWDLKNREELTNIRYIKAEESINVGSHPGWRSQIQAETANLGTNQSLLEEGLDWYGMQMIIKIIFMLF